MTALASVRMIAAPPPAAAWSAQDGAAEVVRRLGACRLGVADNVLHHPLPLVRRQTPAIDPIAETHRAFGCVRFKIRSSIADVQGHRSFPSMAPASSNQMGPRCCSLQ